MFGNHWLVRGDWPNIEKSCREDRFHTKRCRETLRKYRENKTAWMRVVRAVNILYAHCLHCDVLPIFTQRLAAAFGVRSFDVSLTAFFDVWPVVAD